MVLIVKCVFILKMVFFPLFFEMHYLTVFTVFERLCDIKYCHNIYSFPLIQCVIFNTVSQYILLFCYSVFPNVIFSSTFQFLIIFGAGFEVLTVMRIRNVV